MDIYNLVTSVKPVPQQTFQFTSLEKLKLKNSPFLRKRITHSRFRLAMHFSRTRIDSTKTLSVPRQLSSCARRRTSAPRIVRKPASFPKEVLELSTKKKKPAIIVNIAQPQREAGSEFSSK